MEKQRQLKIALVEDSDFFNTVMTKSITNHADEITFNNHDILIEVKSYTHATDFIKELDEDLDLVFLDYYLDNGYNGQQVIKLIKQKCRNCKIIVMSQNRNKETVLETAKNGATEFIDKDNYTFTRACIFMEDVLKSKLAA